MVRWFEDETNPHPFLKALQEVRQLATREGWRYQHVQAIMSRLTSMRKRLLAIANSF